VIGAGTRTASFAERFPAADVLTTDVDLTFSPDAIADALSLPLADASVDLVVAEHVVEHVLDPFRMAAEIERVLRPGGLALIRMPFLYPWHGGFLDFFRATPAGMLVLFAGCDVVHLGPGMGPAAAAAYSLHRGGVELFEQRQLRRVATVLLHVALSPLKWLDPLLTRRFGGVGGSAGITYLGRRSDARRTSAELVAMARQLGRSGPGSLDAGDQPWASYAPTAW
jgi:SAM-dependent methyltransferase